MLSYVRAIAAWLVLAGHVFFGWWLKKKSDGYADSVALRAGAAKEHDAPTNKDELVIKLKEGKL